MSYLERHITRRVRDALDDTPVVAINGPRQVGKSTLVSGLSFSGTSRYLSLDDPAIRASARIDPIEFLDRGVDTLVIDEIQLEPGLFRALKLAVDHDRRPGRFLLTGSSRLLAAPDMADSLVGRVETIELAPFTQGELEGRIDRFVDLAFEDGKDVRTRSELRRADYIDRLVTGGFPDAVARTAPRRRRWFTAYLTTALQRAIAHLADIERAAEIPRILALCAARSATELNVTNLTGELSLSRRTVDAYVALLRNLFLVQLIPGWATNVSAKTVRRPKVFLADSGLTAHLLGLSTARLAEPGVEFGPLLESFVVNEIARQSAWSETEPTLWHFRDRGGAEVDVLLEHPDGRIVGIEVKAASMVGPGDFGGLAFLQRRLGSRFHRGLVLYTGPDPQPFGPQLDAVPISSLWRAGS